LAQAFAENCRNKNYTKEFLINKEKFENEVKQRANTDVPEKPESMDMPSKILNEEFTYSELVSAVAQCKNSTSPGEDDITYEMLKHLPKGSLEVILKFYNRIWEAGTLPKAWKHAIVLPFIKPGKDPSNADSYRPIALTSALCKVMERMITNRLNWYLEKNKLLNPMQTGFRKNKSTLDHIMRLQSDIQNSINHGQYTAGVFLDFSKAYDMIWKNGLMHKISKLNISGNMYNFINDFLSERKIQVKVGDSLSDTQELENGTPQGSVISPFAISYYDK